MPFPTVTWRRETVTFVPELRTELPARHALVFPFYGDRVVLAEIPDRGWCIPSGRIEVGESPEEAARREAYEEAGVTLGRLVPLGSFVFTEPETGTQRHAPAFVAEAVGLGALPDGSESQGRMLVAVEDIAGLYYAWDALLAAVFEEAASAKAQLLPAGTLLSVFTEQPAGSPEEF